MDGGEMVRKDFARTPLAVTPAPHGMASRCIEASGTSTYSSGTRLSRHWP